MQYLVKLQFYKKGNFETSKKSTILWNFGKILTSFGNYFPKVSQLQGSHSSGCWVQRVQPSILLKGCMHPSIFSHFSCLDLSYERLLTFSSKKFKFSKWKCDFYDKNISSPGLLFTNHQCLHPSIQTHYEGPDKNWAKIEDSLLGHSDFRIAFLIKLWL